MIAGPMLRGLRVRMSAVSPDLAADSSSAGAPGAAAGAPDVALGSAPFVLAALAAPFVPRPDAGALRAGIAVSARKRTSSASSSFRMGTSSIDRSANRRLLGECGEHLGSVRRADLHRNEP